MRMGQAADSATAAVRDFFEQHKVASLKLPHGWFGRPHDNQHQLSSVGTQGDEVRIILDGQHVLTVAPIFTQVVGRELRITTSGGRWQWQPYGRSNVLDEEVVAGTIEFHAPFSLE